ncbi:RECEPTOR-LIKE PROTEIN KINASE 2 [Salix viminalis]|uniref:RECEPTOR-LIKE PROTEIN KINASE 2 n=1 Tax=Salix viminalis TaxID=40686 RepID=A0A9Q0TLI3_SALVM|nr:RECEPTOR-LIKE PROTEIN KINASE 2 [Salix viminalis]
MENGEVIAVKKLWPNAMAAVNGCNDEKCGVRDSFSTEVKTLGSIRHKNIVRFLGCCWNRSTRLLMYDYMPNGSLDGLHVVDWVRQKRGGIEVLDPSLLSRPASEIEEMMQALGIALLCVNSSPDERPNMKDVAAMLKEIKHEREEYAKVDVLVKGSPAPGNQENKKSGGVPATSSSNPGGTQNLYPKSNNSSFSAFSLLYSSSSNSKTGFK